MLSLIVVWPLLGQEPSPSFVLIDVGEKTGLGTDPFTLNAAVLAEDTLQVSVSYSGGCRDHIFVLDASGPFLETDPVQLWLDIAHDANSDPCEAWLTEDVSFLLDPLKVRYLEAYQQNAGTIVLQLEGLDDGLTYEFTIDEAGSPSGSTAVQDASWGRIKDEAGSR